MSVSDADLQRRLRLSHGLAVLAALVAGAAVATAGAALAAAAVGTLALAGGLVVRSRTLAVIAGVALFGAAVLGGAGGVPVERVLVAAFAGVLAADFGTFAMGIERDAGPAVPTARVELLHAVGSCTVAILVGAGGYAVARSVTGGENVGFVALVFGVVVLLALLSGEDD